jgi:hypothetical protein
VRTDLAEAAVQGWIEANPQAALDKIDQGVYDDYLKPEDRKRLKREAKEEIHAKEVEERAFEKAQQAELKQQRLETQDQFLNKLAEGTLTWKEIKASNLEPFGEGSKKQFLSLLEQQNKEGPVLKDNPQLFHQTMEKIHAQWGDADKITDETELIKLYRVMPRSAVDALRKEVRELRDPSSTWTADKQEFFKRAESMFRKEAAGIPDPEADANFYKYRTAFEQRAAKLLEEKKDPRVLLDPNSKEFFGKEIFLYKRSQQQIIRGISEQAKASASRPPGDSSTPTYPSAPRDPTQRKAGRVYDTPRGPMKWTGSGWLKN